MSLRKLEGVARQRALAAFGRAAQDRASRLVAQYSRRDVPDDEVVAAIKSVPPHFAGMDSVVAQIQAGMSWQCQNNVAGGIYNPTQQQSAIAKQYSFGTAQSNATSGGGDEVFSFQTGISSGSSATIDLNAMTNLLAQTSVSIARIKGVMIRLLSAADDPTISPAPTASSTMCVTNVGPEVPSPLDFAAGGSAGTVTLTVGSTIVTAVAIGAAGSGYEKSTFFLASPQQTGGSGCVFLCTTNSSGVISAMTFITGAGGTGYTAATVPLIAVGQYTIATGGCHVYFDPIAAGFLLVSSTSKNFTVKNLDGSHAITVETDFLAATS